MFAVEVYKTSVNDDGETVIGRQVNKQMVDTYYGYDYGQIYADDAGKATLEVTSIPLYDAAQSTIEENAPGTLLTASGKILTTVGTYYDPDKDLTVSPHYYDANGRITETPQYINRGTGAVVTEIPDGESGYEPNFAYAYAFGWLVNTSADKTLYQIPVIKVSGLEYGTYRAIIQPRFTTIYGHYNRMALRTFHRKGPGCRFADTVIRRALRRIITKKIGSSRMIAGFKSNRKIEYREPLARDTVVSR